MNLRNAFEELFTNQPSREYLFDWELVDYSSTLIENKHQLPRLLRFSPANYDNIRALERQTVFLSPAGMMNDVFEGITGKIDDRINKRIDEIGDFVFLRSFTESSNLQNHLMWAHYADKYKGFCVEYDFSRINESALYHLFPVYYSNKRFANHNFEMIINEFGNLKRDYKEENDPSDCEFLKDALFLFLSKSCVWSYEKEWRLAATYPQIKYQYEDFCAEDDEEKEMYELNSQEISVQGCVKSVYLGPRMESRYKEHIVEICSKIIPSVEIFESSLAKDKYALVFKRI